MGVGRAVAGPWLPPPRDRNALMVVEENHVHVAGVVHLLTAELAQREHDRPGRSP